MKRKLISILLSTCLTLSLTACGNSNTAQTAKPIEETVTDSESDLSEDDALKSIEAVGNIEVEENLFTVELTIPAEYVENSTQEDLDDLAKKKGFKSITLNEDGSATYVMTKSQHKEMMEELTANINSSLAEMIGSEDYPNITDISANDDFTKFAITTSSTELSLAETFSVMAFYMYGGMYNIFNGTPVNNVHVDFINSDSGEIINTADSSDTLDSE